MGATFFFFAAKIKKRRTASKFCASQKTSHYTFCMKGMNYYVTRIVENVLNTRCQHTLAANKDSRQYEDCFFC